MKTIDALKETGRVLDIWLPLKIKYDKIPGLSVAIAHKGKIVYARGFGFADLATHTKATEKTLYHIASHSKMFTATAVMKLVEEGKLRLDDKVADYVGWFEKKSGDKDARHITVRHLLSHISGIARDGDTPHWNTGKFPKELASAFARDPLIKETSTKFKYTNYGYSILGEVVARASGMSYEEYVTSRIFKPLGLEHTFTDYKDDLRNVATGYGPDLPDAKQRAERHDKANAYAPATGFVSNARDLIAFISSFAQGNKDLLPDYLKREMLFPSAETDEDESYGLGFDISYVKGKKIIGHGGGYGGYTTRTILDPKEDVAITVLSNATASTASGIAFGIMGIAYAFLEQKKPRGSNPYDGVYRDRWGDRAVVAIGDGLVSFSPSVNRPDQRRTFLIPEKGKKHYFRIKATSVFGSDGEIVYFKKLKNGKFQEFVSNGVARRLT